MIRTFKDLRAWQLAMELAVEVYRITGSYPKSELFGITNQLRRAVVSVSSNIAEGFGRNNTKEKDQFLGIAYGSLLEVESQLLLSLELGYISQDHFKSIEPLIVESQKVLMGLKKKNKQNKE